MTSQPAPDARPASTTSEGAPGARPAPMAPEPAPGAQAAPHTSEPAPGARSAQSIRARVRAEMVDEIKAIARRHLATGGADLSMRAVARDLGVVSSAVYRYFPSRDDLLTALIIDAYNALGSAVEAADAAVQDRGDLRGRWLACSNAVRGWALTNPAEYALVFGSPVIGYAAPPDTTVAAIRTPATLVGILADGIRRGTAAAPRAPGLPADLRADLSRVRAQFWPTVPEELLVLGTIGWIHLFGAVSFEVFGQLNNAIDAREAYFELQMQLMADLIGI
jgi:AcrR family transcriptional regulator